jgi:hypothetical protein
MPDLTRKQLETLRMVGSISGDHELSAAASRAPQCRTAMTLCVQRQSWIDMEIALQRAVSVQATPEIPVGKRSGRAVVIHGQPVIRSIGTRTTTRDRGVRGARGLSYSEPSFGGDEVRS